MLLAMRNACAVIVMLKADDDAFTQIGGDRFQIDPAGIAQPVQAAVERAN